MGKSTRAAIDRFNEKVRPLNDGSGCMVWTANSLPKGYGVFSAKSPEGKKRTYLAHRWIYQQIHGVVLGRFDFILHSCDNPPCVNIEHLRIGTAKENTRDMDERGRRNATAPRGEDAGLAKLTECEVLEIRRLHAIGAVNQRDLAIMFRVSKSNIGAIVTRKTWKHLIDA